jgi:hypothetical protein
MGNAKTLSTARKHRHRQAAAKEKLRLHLDGKLKSEELPELAKRYLMRRARVTKRG